MKHPVKTRLAAVQFYLAGNTTIIETARRFGVGRTPLTRWLRAYQQQGESGLEHRKATTYTQAFRLRVVRYVLKNKCSSTQASAHFAIPNETLIQGWVKRYREGGSQALNSARTGPVMSRDKDTASPRPFSEMTLSELKKELDYLRAENAYLKKRRALREEEALREQQKKQK